jgi:type IV pilus assembly protein PilC
MFEKISDQYQDDLEHQTKVVSRVLEPLIIMVVASIVGVILIALYMPLFNLSNVM